MNDGVAAPQRRELMAAARGRSASTWGFDARSASLYRSGQSMGHDDDVRRALEICRLAAQVRRDTPETSRRLLRCWPFLRDALAMMPGARGVSRPLS